MENRDKSTTLLFAYCLSEDQKFLFVSCTDDVGEILETQLISVAVPNRQVSQLYELTLGKSSRVTRFHDVAD